MAGIETITIQGFKAFSSEFILNLQEKHLLMYGENGSGKSSIYYALHCLQQSSLKTDEGKKYFDINNDQNLINKFSSDEEAKIAVGIKGEAWLYTINKNGYTPKLLGGALADFPLDCCFINHQFISRFFNFRNSERINLFPVFLKDILSFYKVAQYLTIGKMYDYLTSQQIPSKKKEKELFKLRLDSFNTETKRVIEDVNLHASDRYNRYFKDNDDRELKIRLRYDSNADKPVDDPNEYWLKYDNIIEFQTIRGVQVSKRSQYKKWNTPYIGLEISEKRADGTFEQIPKPQAYFNEAKLTAIALSVRFALLDLEKAEDGRFLALDDMLISLDMSNRAKVVDFLLDISDRYKIYLFTHNRMFFEYFKHKTKRLNNHWVYKEIYMDDSHQPYMRNSDSYIEEAEYYIRQHKYEIAGNFLRKAAESFCKSFLPPRQQLSADYSRLDLNGMIVNSKDFAIASGMTRTQLFDELDEHRKFILNPSSHDSYDVEKYMHELKRCLNTLKELDKIIIRPFLKRGAKLEFTLRTPVPPIDEYKFEIVLCDDFKVVEQPGEMPVITKGMINYKVSKNGSAGKTQSDNTTLKRFYEVNYDKSDKVYPSFYLDGIKEVGTNNPIHTLL